ncbi:MAG TPA: hypothetical protein VMR95_02270 [Candidatus Binatia bacterium]|nr:hypothetical protein [Candidatus Binatia bacterium]
MAFSFESELERALANAPTDISDVAYMYEEPYPALRVLELVPDEGVISFEGKGNRQGATDVVVEEVDVFKQLLSHPLLWRNQDVETMTVNGIVRHEEAHASAAKKLGAADICFGLTIVYANEEELYFFASSRHGKIITSKLGLAAIFAQPINPSRDDVTATKHMGYGGVEDVTTRTLEHNERVLNGQTDDANGLLPVPMSYSLRSFSPELP